MDETPDLLYLPDNNKCTGTVIMRYRAVIFDLDGTLLDTLEDLAGAGNRVLRRAGLPEHPVGAYRYFVGEGLTALISRILPEELRDRGRVERFAREFREEYGRTWRVNTCLYEGIAPLLDKLAHRQVSLNVLSNKPHDFTLLCVREFLSAWNFEVVAGRQEGVPRKPDPAGALAIARALGREPSEILYLGDTATDMRTAVAARMFAVGALWGFREAEELRENGAAKLVKHPLEVATLL